MPYVLSDLQLSQTDLWSGALMAPIQQIDRTTEAPACWQNTYHKQHNELFVRIGGVQVLRRKVHASATNRSQACAAGDNALQIYSMQAISTFIGKRAARHQQ
jgi:hypothetical protein